MVPLILLAILLFAHYGLFIGDTFFVDLDTTLNGHKHIGNAQSEGWRYDIGFGISQYFNDPGLHHWSLTRWWYKLFINPVVGDNILKLGLLWVTSVGLFFLIKKAIPELAITTALLLSPMLVLGSLRHKFFFGTQYTTLSIGTIFLALILYDFLNRPSPRHYFLYTLTLFLAFFLGNSACLIMLVIFATTFFLAYVYYYREDMNFGDLLFSVRRFFFLNLFSGISIFLLGAWVFYSIFLEQSLVGYARDPDYSPIAFYMSRWKDGLWVLIDFFHAGLFSPQSQAMGLNYAFPSNGWQNVSPILPILMFLMLFYKSRDFWEFGSKVFVFGFIAHGWLEVVAPEIVAILRIKLNLFDLRFHPVFQVFQVIMIGILIRRMQSEDEIIDLTGVKLAKGAAGILFFLYAGLTIVALSALGMPAILESALHAIYRWSSTLINYSAKIAALLPTVISENVLLWNESMGWKAIFFYGSSFFIIFLFLVGRWPIIIRLGKGYVFAGILLVNSIFLASAIFPINKDPLIWDEQEIGGINLSRTFIPTDRVMKVGLPGCKASFTVECVKEKYFEGRYGARRNLVGYQMTPLLDISPPKNFTQKDVSQMVKTFFRLEGRKSEGALRQLTTFPYMPSSRLYDLTATNYILSKGPLSNLENLELVYEAKQFYLYKNLQAWMYFYLAERIEKISTFEDFYNAEKGVAYLWRTDDDAKIPENLHGDDSYIKLSKFTTNEMLFQYYSTENEFLVVADAWHPFWRAKIDGIETKVIKANGVFKGIFLPPGEHNIRLYFDNSPFLPGVWVTLIVWPLFIGGWVWVAIKEKSTYNQ